MSDITKTLHEQYRNDWEEAKSLLARAADEKRELSAEEEQRWDALNASMSARKSKMDQVAAAEERSEKIGALAERALKVENAVKADNDADVLRAIASGEKRRAQFEIRALASAAATVPVTFADFVVVALTEGNPVYDGATKLRTTTGEQITLPRVTLFGREIVVRPLTGASAHKIAALSTQDGAGDVMLGALLEVVRSSCPDLTADEVDALTVDQIAAAPRAVTGVVNGLRGIIQAPPYHCLATPVY